MTALSPTWQILMAAAASPFARAQPFPHARKKPDITLEMLQALKDAVKRWSGTLTADSIVCFALFNRGLATRTKSGATFAYKISDAGRLLIRTQYDALLKVLTNDLTAGEPKR